MFQELIERQGGAVAREQLVAYGTSDGEVQAEIKAGRWQRLYWGVYYVHNGPVAREARLWGAVLRAGPGAMLSHSSAAEAYGLLPESTGPIHVMVPANRRVRGERDLVVHPSIHAERALNRVLSPPRSRIDETIMDLIDTSSFFSEAVGWVTRACGGRLTTAERLRSAIELRSRIRWRAEIQEVIKAVADGAQSPLEVHYLQDVERKHGLPSAIRQRVTQAGGRREYNDVHYEGYATTVELDGRLNHEGDHRFRDMRRDNALHIAGETVLRYGWSDIRDNPCGVAQQVAQVLRTHGWLGIPKPCTAESCVFQP